MANFILNLLIAVIPQALHNVQELRHAAFYTPNAHTSYTSMASPLLLLHLCLLLATFNQIDALTFNVLNVDLMPLYQ